MAHFYRGCLLYFAFGEESDSNNEKARIRKGNPPSISRQKHMTKLNVSNEAELTAFLSFWLSRFVLPYDNEIIRPETFVIAALMASGKLISLAPIVPGYIYHGLGEAASHPAYPSKANVIFPSISNRLVSRVVSMFICSSL